MENFKPIDIRDYSITFYGGPEGFQNKCRVIVALYDVSGKTSGWIKFYNDGVEIENDFVDDTGAVHMNLPHNCYLDVLSTLRGKRPLQIVFHDKAAMFLEFKNPPSNPKKGINLN